MEVMTGTVGMLAAAAAEEGRLFGLDPQLLHDAVLLGINIFILFLILSYLLFNTARDMLRKRREGIQSDLEHAEKVNADALAMKQEYEARLTDIHKEEEQILSQARRQAKLQEAEIISAAREEAVLIKDRARADIALERKKAMDEMKKEMISVASLMAGKVVSAQINTEVQDTLVEETLKEIGEDTWQSR